MYVCIYARSTQIPFCTTLIILQNVGLKPEMALRILIAFTDKHNIRMYHFSVCAGVVHSLLSAQPALIQMNGVTLVLFR